MLWFLCYNTSLLGLRAKINTLRSEKLHSHSGYNSKSAINGTERSSQKGTQTFFFHYVEIKAFS